MRARRFFSGSGQDQGVGGSLGGAPGPLGGVADVAGFKAFDGLGLHRAGVGEYLVNARLSGASAASLPPYGSHLPRHPVAVPSAWGVVNVERAGFVSSGEQVRAVSQQSA